MSRVTDNLGGKRKPKWRNARKGGRPVLRSPDGRIYYGTAGEVRDAGLSPSRRGMLADWLQSLQHRFLNGDLTAGELREYAASRRRDAILMGATDLRTKHWVAGFSLRDSLRIGAAARSQGVDVEAFVERLALTAVAEAEARCGGRLPFTRHERAALARCQG